MFRMFPLGSRLGTSRRRSARQGGVALMLLVFLLAALATGLVAYVLVTMFNRKQEARQPFVRVANVTEISTDPEPWGLSWPHHFDGWKATAGDKFYGGSSAMPESKLEKQPWLKRLYAGYAFSIDYRKARGHAYMLYDQGVTERVTKKPQSGACLHCHASATVLYRKTGLEAMGLPADEAALSADFNMPAVIRGFKELSRKPYSEVQALLASMPDGTPGENTPVFPAPPAGGFKGEMAGAPVDQTHQPIGESHPVTCIDCHDPKSMAIRITRPGFIQGIADLAAGDAPTPHLPSVERWRRGDRSQPYDPNHEASRQEMRSFVCGQCHVEYYCGPKATLTFPWKNGLKVEDLERTWDETKFEKEEPFADFVHAETSAKVYKVQHPEFELWSQGIHARSGVACADCHMPYERRGAMKVSSHNVRSPLLSVNTSCQNCHHSSETELISRVATIQQRTIDLTERAAKAMTDMLDAIVEAKKEKLTEQSVAELDKLQRQAMWRLDFISSENSHGFHADQESARVLAESIDFSRQAQVKAVQLKERSKPATEAK